MRKNKKPLLLLFLAAAVVIVTWRLGTRPAPRSPSAPVESAEARLGPPDIYPDPVRTPGALNPDITQYNLRETICNPRWSTRSIRPPVAYTNRLKFDQIREYGYPDTNMKIYEEDHLVPLALGGSPTDPRNLWPEPYETSVPDGGARFKDKVEDYLRVEVCSGNLTLEQAQSAIVRDWYRVYSTSVPH
jgi:hypothetical protein